MKRTIERITRTAMLAVAFMLCATSAWAEEMTTRLTAPAAWGGTKPLAVWNGDFPTSGSEARGSEITVTLNLNGNSSTGDSITINSSNGGIFVSPSVTQDAVTIIAKMGSLTGGTSTQILGSIGTGTGTGEAYTNRCMIGLASTTKMSAYTYSNGAPSIFNDTALSGAWNLTGSSAYYAFMYDKSAGTICYTNGVACVNAAATAGKLLRYGSEKAFCGTIGGMYGKGTYNASSGTIGYLAVYNKNDSGSVKAWSLMSMTAAENITLTDGVGALAGGANVGVNLNGGMVTVSGVKTAAALFVQDNTTLDFSGDTTSRLDISGPLYVADGKTLTIKLGELSSGWVTPISMGSCFAGDGQIVLSYNTPNGYVTSPIVSAQRIKAFTQTVAEAEAQAQATIDYSRWSTSVNSVWTWTTPLTANETFIDAGGSSSRFTRFDTSTGRTAQTGAGPYAGSYQATSADNISPVSGDEQSYIETYRGQQYNKYSLFWYYWCHTSDYTYYKLQGFYASPGRALRIAPDPDGVTSYHKMIGATFGPLTFGGMIVEPGANGYSIWTSRSNDSDRSSILGNPDGGTGDTWFEFRESLEFNRKGAFWIVGTVNFDIAAGRVVNLNDGQTSDDYHPIIYGSIAQDNDETLSGGCLKMHGGGQIAAKKLTATGACLDYSDLSAAREVPYIDAQLVVDSNTSYKFPALAGAATYQLAYRLSDTSGITGDQTFSIGGHEYKAPLSFNDASGEVVFPAVATLNSDATWSAISWDAKPATIGSSDVVTLNVTGNTTLDIAAATSIKKLVLNIADGVELELTNISNLSSEDGIVLRGTGTLKIGSSTSLSALAIEDDVSISIADGGSITVSNNATVADGKTLTIGVPTYTTWGADGAKRIISATSFAGAVNFSGSTTPSGCHLEAKNDGIYLVNETAVDWRSFSINFYHDDNSKINTSSSLGLESIAGNYWNNVAGGVGTTTSLLGMSRGLTYSYVDPSLSVAVSNVQGSYHSTRYSSNTDLRCGFIHDHNNTYATPTVTFSNIPFDAYRVIVYHSTDSKNNSAWKHFGYDTINGKSLTYKDGELDYGTTVWGDVDAEEPALPIAEGANALISDITTGSTLTVVSHRIQDEARAGIAAIQIIKAYPVAISDGSNYFGTLFPSAASDGDYVVNVTADSPDTTLLTFGEAVTVRSLTLNIAEGKVLVVSGGSNLSASKVVVNGPGRLQLNSNETLPSLYVAENTTLGFAEEVGLTVTGSINVYSGKTLFVAPTAMAATSRSLITASSIKGTLSVTAPTDAGNTYELATATTTTTTVTLKRIPLAAYQYNAAVSKWDASGFGSGFGNTSVTKVRPGPSEAYANVFEITDGFHPYSSFSSNLTGSFSFAIYADVSQMLNVTSGADGKRVMLGVGTYSDGSVTIYREGDYVKVANVTSTEGEIQGEAKVAYTPGYHLWMFVYDATAKTLTLYRDGETHGTGDAFDTLSLGNGFQIGNVHGNLPKTFWRGYNMAVAAVVGYNAALTAGEVANIASTFPATDGTVIAATIDNKYNDSTIRGTDITIYGTMTATGNKYLGISGAATLNIPTGTAVNVPHMRTQNVGSGNSTVNINGTINVTSESTQPNVYSERDQYKGILFGHWNNAGTGTYNIERSGILNAPNAWLQTEYGSGKQTINIKGGRLTVKGLYSKKADNASVNLSDGGVLEISATTTSGEMVAYNFGYGTFKAKADISVSSDNKMALTLSGTIAEPTTFDAAGNTLTLYGASVGGSGYFTVIDSIGEGSVVITGASTATLLLTDENRDLMNISTYTGKILYQGTEAETLAKLDRFGGTVYFTSNIDATALDLSGATVHIADNCTFTAVAGKEGSLVLGSGAVATLNVTEEVANYEGYFPTVSGSGTISYYQTDGTPGELTGADHVNGNNLMPYYNVWEPSANGENNTISADAAARWRLGRLPDANKNVAFKLSGDTTVTIDATITFKDVQVYGTGSLTIQQSGNNVLTVGKGLYTTANTTVQIDSGLAFASGAKLDVACTMPRYIAVNCGTAESPFEIPDITGSGWLVIAKNKGLTTGSLTVGALMVQGKLALTGAGSATTASVYAGGVVDVSSGTSLMVPTLEVNGTLIMGGNTLSATTISGTGRVEYTNKLPDTSSWSTGTASTGWRGTVAFSQTSNLTGTNLNNYGNAYSTVALTGVSGSNTYLSDTDITTNVRVEGTVTINNGNPIDQSDFNWTKPRVVVMPSLDVNGVLTFRKVGNTAWNPTAYCYYYTSVLKYGSGGSIDVGNQFCLRVDAVDFASALSGNACQVPLTLTRGGDNKADGILYGPNGVAGEVLPVTVGGVANGQKLVHATVNDTTGLYLAVASVTENETTTYYPTLAAVKAAVGNSSVTINLLENTSENVALAYGQVLNKGTTTYTGMVSAADSSAKIVEDGTTYKVVYGTIFSVW